MKTGLVSVSFRQLKPEQIVSLASACKLDCIEWGGDVHAPVGALEQARQIGEMTRANGMEVACYGSYYHLTDREGSPEDLIRTAEALKAPLIRVWAGDKGSADTTERERESIVRNARKLADYGMEIAFEYHGNTLTDDVDSARALLDAVGRANVGCLWQPPVGMDTENCVQGIYKIASYLRNVHVFSWSDTQPIIRYPLRDGEDKWHACLDVLKAVPGEHRMMLEFVAEDSPEQLKQDAMCLKDWLKGVWRS